MRKIALANLKGGVGKTATATALAVGLARRGLKTLCVDCDPSGNASWTLLAGQGADAPTLAEVLTRQVSAEDAIRPSSVPGLDVLPADATLGGVNVALASELGRDTRLRGCLDGLDGRYAFVILDTGPTTTTLLVNALAYAEEVIIPIDSGIYAVIGLTEMERVIAEIREAYNPALRLAGLLLTKVARTKVAADVEGELRTRFGATVFKTVIPSAVSVEAAHARGLTVTDHAPKSPPALAYTQLVEEVVSHGREKARVKTVRRSGKIDAA